MRYYFALFIADSFFGMRCRNGNAFVTYDSAIMIIDISDERTFLCRFDSKMDIYYAETAAEAAKNFRADYALDAPDGGFVQTFELGRVELFHVPATDDF